MSANYDRYQFDKSSRKFDCPKCHKKTFVRYIDTVSNSYAPDQYGKCDRADKCNYHNAPQPETLCYFAEVDSIREISAKAYKVTQGERQFLIPKKVVFEQSATGIYIAKYFVEEAKFNCKLNCKTSDQRYFSDAGSTKVEKPQIKPKAVEYFKIFSTSAKEIDFEQQYFTEIDTFSKGNDSTGILHYYSLNELCSRLNHYRKTNGEKTANPAILKGIYKGGTAGEFCTASAPFLFFDIDVKDNENPELMNPETNSKVFEALRDFCLLVWRSNSQRGIAGVLYFPQLSTLGSADSEKHLTIAKEAYNYLSGYLRRSTGLRIKFDAAQGKFRQIRYLAEQREKRYLNFNSLCLIFQQLPFIPVPDEVFYSTLRDYEQNNFLQNLLQKFDVSEVTKTVELYRLGTAAAGAITFPFIDISGNVRAVQIKNFDEQNHTTGKTTYLHSEIAKEYLSKNEPLPEWLHIYKDQPKVTCLFGEQLLREFPANPVAIVEAPKTAIYGTLYFGSPEIQTNFIWLAVGAKKYLNFERLKVLQGREVFVFPDLSNKGETFAEWETKVKQYEQRLPGTKFIFSDLLERYAIDEQRQQGADLADVLSNLNPVDFRPKRAKTYEEYTYEERIKIGLKMFPVPELRKFAEEMFADKNSLSYYEIKYYLQNIEGLQGNDVSDLMDVLTIRNVIQAVSYPNYILTP